MWGARRALHKWCHHWKVLEKSTGEERWLVKKLMKVNESKKKVKRK